VRFEPGPGPRTPTTNGTVPPAADHKSTRTGDSSSVAPSHADLASWLLAQEIGGKTDVAGLADATEQVFQKLSRRLSTLVSAGGSQALVARALHVARAEFPFFEGVRVGTTPERCFEGLSERSQTVEANEARMGLVAVLGILLDVLVGLVGEDLTVRLVGEIWPGLPSLDPGRHGNSDGQEANS
jgi:hypothetical protein